jgi:hypothetical protein
VTLLVHCIAKKSFDEFAKWWILLILSIHQKVWRTIKVCGVCQEDDLMYALMVEQAGAFV